MLRSNRTHKTKILKNLEQGWSIGAACRAAKVHRQRYYEWRKDDPEFAKLADDAIETGTDMLEDSATQQAIDGNAALMTLLLKGRRRSVYGDKQAVELTGPDEGPLQLVHRVRIG